MFSSWAAFMAVILAIILYYKWRYSYWKKYNVPFLKARFPLGTAGNWKLNSDAFGTILQKQYQEAKAKGLKHVGIFILDVPVYVPIHPDYVKNVMIKDADRFLDRGVYFNEKDDPLSANIFSHTGTKWQKLRVKLTPAFTPVKMKTMFPKLLECGRQLKDHVDQNYADNTRTIDVKTVAGCLTTDVIGSCAFGLNCNSFEDPDSSFRKHLQRYVVRSKFEYALIVLGCLLPNLTRLLGISLTANELNRFVTRVIQDSVHYREKRDTKQNDLLQTLIELKKAGTMTMTELTAEALIFLIGAYETSSSAFTFCLYELSRHSQIQEKVREEIQEVLGRYQGNLTYDAINELKYLGQAIKETLRKYPTFQMLVRRCCSDYHVPNTEAVIKKGTLVLLPVLALHYDEDYFPDPQQFDPDRFGDDAKIASCTYMPFGEGPRKCIAYGFGMAQIKVGLALLLKDYKFSVSKRTKLPLKFSPVSIPLNSLGDIWLDFEKI